MAKLKIYTAESVHNFLYVQEVEKDLQTSVKLTLTRRRDLRTLCLFFLLTVCLIRASFETDHVSYGQNAANMGSTSRASAAGGSSTYDATANPARIQEGFNTTITVEALNEIANTTVRLNVTDPSGASYATMLSIIINGTGFGTNSTQYWGNFTGDANTKYVGVYLIAVYNITTNEILANANFTVGLADKLEYRRTETVQIRAVGYSSGENVTISLTTSNTSIAGYPKTILANNTGVVTDAWPIPSDATPGKYQVQLFSTTNETKKKTLAGEDLADEEVFTVLGAICSIRTMNLADQAVADVVVEAYNATSNVYLNLASRTNSSGWAVFNLDQGNYTFKAFFRDAEVGSLPSQIIMADETLTIQLRLVNVVATAETAAGEKVQSIAVDLKYNYTTRDNTSLTQTDSLPTNTTGMAEFHNLFTNLTYQVNAKRYDLLFHNTTLTIVPDPAPWISLQLTLPNNRLNLRVFDSKGASAVGLLVKIYEFSETVLATPLQSFEIDSSGVASSVFPFGRYRVRAFEDDLLLNETIVNLVNDPTDIDFNLETANLEVTVSVYDYFGGPLANAEVRIERGSGSQYVFVESGLTGADGSVTFASIIGGNSRVFVYLAGRPVAVATQFLASGSNRVTFRLNEYVAVFGFAIETGTFVLMCFFVVLIVVFLVLMRGRLARVVRWRGGG